MRRLTGPHKNRYAIFMGPAVLPVLSTAMRLVTLFYLFNYSDTTPDDGKHQDVDTGFAVFPCCAVEGEADVLPAENREDEAGNIDSADKIPGKETLHTAIDGFRLGL